MGQKLWCTIIFFIILSLSQNIFAKGGSKPWATTISMGYSSQDFKGDSSSTFNKIQHYVFDFKLQWYRKWYTLGFAYSTIPSINISSFLLSNGETGHYQLSFSQMFLVAGAVYKKTYYNLLIGSENTQWAGSPNMSLVQTSHSITGFEIGYAAFAKRGFDFPVWIRFLSKPSRNLEFTNFPNDTITVESGTEIVLAASARFQF